MVIDKYQSVTEINTHGMSNGIYSRKHCSGETRLFTTLRLSTNIKHGLINNTVIHN